MTGIIEWWMVMKRVERLMVEMFIG